MVVLLSRVLVLVFSRELGFLFLGLLMVWVMVVFFGDCVYVGFVFWVG